MNVLARASAAALLLLAADPALAAPAHVPHVDRAVRDRVAMVLRTEDLLFQPLDLPNGLPETFTLTLEQDDGPRTVELRRHSLRAPGFRVRTHGAGGRTVAVVPPPSGTYRGRVRGEPGSVVLASLGPSGLEATIHAGARAPLKVEPVSRFDPEADPTLHVAHPVVASRSEPWSEEPPRAANLPLDHRGLPAVPWEGDGGLGRVPLPRAQSLTGIGEEQHRAEIAFDVDFQYHELKGSSVDESVAAVEAIVNELDYFFARDVMITYVLTDVLVRTEQYYFPTDGGDLLTLFREEWTTNQAGVPHDLAHLMTAKDNIQYGGLAWVGTACTGHAYGWSLDSVGIVAHETTHNWGGQHAQDVHPCNTMYGGCLAVGPNLKDTIVAHRDSRDCLDLVGPHPDPLPPFAHPDMLTVTREELLVMEPTPVDVLANDHDGNADPLSIESFDATSQLGGAVTLSPGTGTDGLDELVYTPPDWVFAGPDSFTYTVGDGTGLHDTGTVTLRVTAATPDVVGHWKLDDAAGLVALDSSGNERHGSVSGDALWTTGHLGGALELDGVDDAVAIPPLDLNSNTVTVTAWLRRAGEQADEAGIVYSWGGGTHAGLYLRDGSELRYVWDGSLASWGWPSGLRVPEGPWVLVALVVEPQQATLYLFDGTLHSAVNVLDHAPEEFDSPLRLGSLYGRAEGGRLRGALDDVRLHGRALGAEEIAALATGRGKAEAPNPPDGGELVASLGELSWSAGLGALSHDVYLGDDYVAVRDATRSSAEYRGSRPNVVYHPPEALVVGATYYWRVDEVADDGVVTGDVWLLEVVRPVGHWPLDEATGSTAADELGGHHGTHVGSPVPGGPGATPLLGRSIAFDDVDDRVEVPPLNLHSDRVSLLAWLRRDGDQPNSAGIVVSRDGDTVAGLNFGRENELRYHWNDAHGTWDSGLVIPDREWVFVALVVRPDRATVYLGNDGELSSAARVFAHGPEEFDGVTSFGRDSAWFRAFRGELDDVWIYDAVLTDRDVETIYRDMLARREAGSVPDGGDVPGAPLTVTKAEDGAITIVWSSSCRVADDDYAVYEGEVGDFAGHVPVACGTEGETSLSLVPLEGTWYYVVVPVHDGREGSPGVDSEGRERAPGHVSCFPRAVGACD